MIFGAGVAGVCTSGYILSSGMPFAVSSSVYVDFVFIGLLVPEEFFIRKTIGEVTAGISERERNEAFFVK